MILSRSSSPRLQRQCDRKTLNPRSSVIGRSSPSALATIDDLKRRIVDVSGPKQGHDLSSEAKGEVERCAQDLAAVAGVGRRAQVVELTGRCGGVAMGR